MCYLINPLGQPGLAHRSPQCIVTEPRDPGSAARHGKALGRLAGNGMSWIPARLCPGSELHWRAHTGLGRNRPKAAGKLHHLKSNRVWMPWPRIAQAVPPASPTTARGGFPMYFYFKITSPQKEDAINSFVGTSGLTFPSQTRFSFANCKAANNNTALNNTLKTWFSWITCKPERQKLSERAQLLSEQNVLHRSGSLSLGEMCLEGNVSIQAPVIKFHKEGP